MDVRRVITGFEPDGHATVTVDEPTTDGMTMPDQPGWEFATVGSTPADLALPAIADSHAAIDPGVAPGATQLAIWRLPDGQGAPMHATDTVDYILVLSGHVSMRMPDGKEVELDQGDCVVQNGTGHEWNNRSGADCVMAVFMVGARRA